jgi:hypothetical protein
LEAKHGLIAHSEFVHSQVQLRVTFGLADKCAVASDGAIAEEMMSVLRQSGAYALG